MFIDTHIHTGNYSEDAVIHTDDLLTFIQENGPGLFCATEHYDYDYPYRKHQLIFDLDKCHSAYQVAKATYEDKTQSLYPVLFGIEYGYRKDLAAYYDELSKQKPFDQIISSVHYFDQCDPYFDRHIYVNGKKAIYSRYLEVIADCLESSDGFDVVGHFDYISRYAPYPDRKIYYRDFPDLFDTIFSLCIRKGKALEFNTRAAAQFKAEGCTDYLFDSAIPLRYKEMGGQMITLSSDAHYPFELLQLFDEAKAILVHAGFRYLTYYQHRIPYSIPI